jgi:hypothetical protein
VRKREQQQVANVVVVVVAAASGGRLLVRKVQSSNITLTNTHFLYHQLLQNGFPLLTGRPLLHRPLPSPTPQNLRHGHRDVVN